MPVCSDEEKNMIIIQSVLKWKCLFKRIKSSQTYELNRMCSHFYLYIDFSNDLYCVSFLAEQNFTMLRLIWRDFNYLHSGHLQGPPPVSGPIWNFIIQISPCYTTWRMPVRSASEQYALYLNAFLFPYFQLLLWTIHRTILILFLLESSGNYSIL